MILPYTSRGVLYAAKVMTGVSGQSLPPSAPADEHAAATRVSAMSPVMMRGARRYLGTGVLLSVDGWNSPARSPGVRSTERPVDGYAELASVRGIAGRLPAE